MPTDHSNFTMPDVGGYNNGRSPGAKRQRINSLGQWEDVPDDEVTAQPIIGAWGGTGDSLDAGGNPIAGTNGMAVDRDRYRYQSQTPTNATGPQIGRTQSDETRGMSMGALGLLQQTAMGATPSAAEQLGTAQGQAAQNAQYSIGASVRGGAMARAAAARNATMQAATIGAQTRQSNAATRAGEMATARGAYYGAVSGQRGQDIGLATSQAGLEVGQRGQNDNREAFYEGLAQDTQQANLNHQLGRSESDAASAQATYNNGVARDEAGRRAGRETASALLGGTSGLVQGVGYADKANPAEPKKSDDPWDTSRYSGSDERMKTGAKPLGKGVTSRLQDRTRGVIEGLIASRDAILPQHARESQPIGTDALHAGIAQSIADDASESPNYGVTREDGDLSGHNLHLSKAEKGYAASRAGQAGYMFGDAPKADYTEQLWGGDAPAHRSQQMAPGTDDFARYGAPVDRNVMTSDAHAKQAAYELGMKQGVSLMSGDNAGLSGPRGKVSKTEGHAATEEKHARAVPPNVRVMGFQRDEPGSEKPLAPPHVEESGYVQAARDVFAPRGVPLPQVGTTPMVGLQAGQGIGAAMQSSERGYQAALAPVQPGAMRAQTTSDERAKQDAHGEGSMAGANRSMAPFEYEYKPGYAEEAGQHEGEKNVGPMAQYMAKDPVAASALVRRPDGMLAIDKDKGLKLVMGSVADLQMQLDGMKKRKGSR